MLNTPLDKILGSPAKVRLLRFFSRTDPKVSGRQAERLAGVSHRSANLALNDLAMLGVLDREEVSSQHLYSLNKRHPFFTAIRSLFAEEVSRSDAIVAQLREAIVQANLERESIIGASLFGSAARGDDEPGSDVDFLCIVALQDDVERIYGILSNAGDALWEICFVRLSPLVIELDDMRVRMRQGDTLVHSIVQDERVLYGASVSEVGEIIPHDETRL